jgi:NAD(P)-dependent dehydrogenase (short-subunit alcohol dehydrogenase family)
VAVVTGAGSGIGLATAGAFLAAGARVVAADLDPSAVSALDGGGGAALVRADLAEAAAPAAVVGEAVNRFGTVDVLVNNVGVCPHRDGFLSVTDDDWTALFNLNVLCMVRASRAVLPHMVRQGRGAIVSIASDAGHVPGAFFVDYSVSKAAVIMLSKAIASEFGPTGVRANCVSPGPTRTPAFESGEVIGRLAESRGVSREAATEHFLTEVRRMPLGRLGAPEDVANVVLFLASDLARQVTGADYRVDGGLIPTP